MTQMSFFLVVKSNHVVTGQVAPIDKPLQRFTGDTIEVGGMGADIIDCHGHAFDHVVFHIPANGWLFSGDAFVYNKVIILSRQTVRLCHLHQTS